MINAAHSCLILSIDQNSNIMSDDYIYAIRKFRIDAISIWHTVDISTDGLMCGTLEFIA